MTSERVQRRIDRLLDETEAAVDREDWQAAHDLVRRVLLLDPENKDALAYQAIAERGTQAGGPPLTAQPSPAAAASTQKAIPASFDNGRYTAKKFLGEGGKKQVYLAHDASLDRDVAFALIKTEGLDGAGRQRIQREAQAMGRLGSHPHIVAVYDIGEEQAGPSSSRS